MTAVSVVANIAGVYGEGEFRRDRWAACAAAACSCVDSYVALRSMLAPTVGAAPQPKRFIPTPPAPPCLCRAYPYVALVNNFAQAWALYCLVLLYQASATAGGEWCAAGKQGVSLAPASVCCSPGLLHPPLSKLPLLPCRPAPGHT